MKISCVIHTHNSSAYIESVIKSVLWCDEIVIIDMESTDNTVDLVKQFETKIYTHKNIGYADPARAFGLSKCSHDWILAIDSDEIVPPKLAQKLREIVNKNQAEVVYLSFRNFFFGKELQGTGWSYKNIIVPRFFKRGFLEYQKEVHNFIQIRNNPKIIKLIEHDLAIVHFNYLDIHHFIHKLNNYTDFESEKSIYNLNPLIYFPYQLLREFFGRFIILKGYLDGWVGFYLSFAMVFYRWTSYMKAKSPRKGEIFKTYHKIAKETLNNLDAKTR
jgi:glycosyltransferase involved in cell wall biosynthesis